MKQASKSILFVKYIILTLCLGALVGCTSKIEKEIQKIPMEFEFHRFDKAFAKASVEDLAEIRDTYPLFFDPSLPDSFWIEKLNDTLQIELEQEVIKAFPEDEPIYESVKKVFQHVKYYFPRFEPPTVYTSTTDVAYETKVILSGRDMVIGLDTYLGSDHYFYEGVQQYFRKNMNSNRMPVDVATELAAHTVAPIQDRTFLSQMIYFGKVLYMTEFWVPDASEALVIGYTEDEWEWALENEEDIWRYFIERELLYSTERGLKERFIDYAPFSKFYLEIDNESPGRIGAYMGWQIVTSYMKRNDVSMEELAILDADLIYKNSNYKPRKK